MRYWSLLYRKLVSRIMNSRPGPERLDGLVSRYLEYPVQPGQSLKGLGEVCVG